MFVSSVCQKRHHEEKYDSGINTVTGMVSRCMVKFVIQTVSKLIVVSKLIQLWWTGGQTNIQALKSFSLEQKEKT